MDKTCSRIRSHVLQIVGVVSLIFVQTETETEKEEEEKVEEEEVEEEQVEKKEFPFLVSLAGNTERKKKILKVYKWHEKSWKTNVCYDNKREFIEWDLTNFEKEYLSCNVM